MARGFLVRLIDGALGTGDTLVGPAIGFNATTTIGTGSWTWSGTDSADDQTYSNITDTGTYFLAQNGSVYFVPDNQVPSELTAASVTTAPTFANETTASTGDETLTGGGADDVIYGGADTSGTNTGDDSIDGGAGDDLIFAGDGNDSVTGSSDNDTIYGGDGNDILAGDDPNGGSPSFETLSWEQIAADGTDISGGVFQSTGDMSVMVNFNDDGNFTGAVISDAFQFLTFAGTSDEDSSVHITGDNTTNDNEDDGNGQDLPTVTVSMVFTSNQGSGQSNQVEDVTFIINDVDSGIDDWIDQITVNAYDIDGNPVLVDVFPAFLSDTANGQTVTAGEGDDEPEFEEGAAEVFIGGPVHSIEVIYRNLGEGQQEIWLTDVTFTTIPAGAGDDTLFGDAGDDTLFGYTGDDSLDGGADDDTLYGGAGNDSLSGAAGGDLAFGGSGNDDISGGDDHDSLFGGAGADTLSGDTGNDRIEGGAEADTLFGGSGDDILLGETGADTLFGGADSDVLFGGEADDSLNAGTGDDTVFGGAGNDTADLGDGNDTFGNALFGDDGSDTVFGGLGDDTINDGEGNDALFGGAGNDTFIGLAENDEAFGGTGDDRFAASHSDSGLTITGGEDVGDTDIDRLELTAPGGVDVTLTGSESGSFSYQTSGQSAAFSQIERVETGNDADTVTAATATGGVTVATAGGDDSIAGSDFGDTINAGGGADTVTGGAGGDTIDGGAGNDALSGGAGNDTLSGSEGADTFTVEATDGADAIFGGESDAQTDTLQLNASGPAQDATVTLASAEAGSYTLGAAGGIFGGIERVQTGDGNDLIDGSATTGAMTLAAGTGDDTVIGTQGDDSIDGGAGADTLDGGLGNDTINLGADADGDVVVLANGDGDDVLLNFTLPTDLGGGAYATNDRLDVTGLKNPDGTQVDVADITVTDDGSGNALLSFPSGDTLTLIGTPPAALSDPAIMVAMGIPLQDQIVEGTAGDDIIDAGYIADPEGDKVDGQDALDASNDDLIEAYGGNDSINAGTGNDTIFGGTGNDSLIGEDGDDTLHGDDGNDFLNGVTGNDALFGGAGEDAIESGAGNDSIYGGTGNDSVNGDVGEDHVYGGAGDDTVRGSFGNDTVYGGEGDDFVWGGFGDDVHAVENNFGNDTYFGDSEQETFGDTLDLSAVTDDLTVDLTDGVNEIGSFTDGTSTATFTEIEHIVLGSGLDTLVLADGGGSDWVQGFNAPTPNGDGSYAPGDQLDVTGLTNDFGFTPVDVTDVTVTDDGSGNATISFPGGESITLIDVAPADIDNPLALSAMGIPIRDGIVDGTDNDDIIDENYADDPHGDVVDGNDATLPGTTGEDDFILAGDGDDTVDAGLGNDEVLGEAGNDSISGGIGDDTLVGGTGNDSLLGGIGEDQISGDAGNDNLRGDDGDDIIFGGSGADTITGNQGADLVYGGSGNDTIGGGDFGGQLPGSGDGGPTGSADTLFGGAGDDTLHAGNGADTVYGGTGNDVINGSAGDDSLAGGDGDDTFVLDGAIEAAAIDGGAGSESGSGDTLDLTGQTADITVDLSGTPTDRETGTVSDGTGTATFTEIETIAFGAGNDTLIGADQSEIRDGAAGNDSLDGRGGNDRLFGGLGDDTLTGGTGSDTLTGGAGDDRFTIVQSDTAYGGDGDDTFDLTAGTGTANLVIDGGNSGEANGDTLNLAGLVSRAAVLAAASDDGTGSLSGTVTLNDGRNLTFSDIENIICFTTGTRIATPQGARAIETLAIGDMVVTRDHGLQPIRWIGQRTVPGTGKLAPIRLSSRILPGLTTDLWVSPQHRMLFQGYQAELLFGESEVLAPAKHLIDGTAVTADPRAQVTYVHMMFDEHEIVFAEGAATESFHPGNVAMDTITDAARDELFSIFPELRVMPETYGGTARRCLRKHEVQLLKA